MQPTESLWQAGAGEGGVTSATFSPAFRRYLALAGMAPSCVHILRHTAAKLRRDAGESIEAVSAFLDHASLAVTTVYSRRLEGAQDTGWARVAEAIGAWTCFCPVRSSNTVARGPVRRIDAHVHAFPDRLALAVRGHLGARGHLEGGPFLPDVAALARDSGFDRAWVLPYAHRAGVAESVNEWSAEKVAAFPWLVPGATFHPDDEDLPRLVERALVELRLRVVKLHCSVGRFSPADLRLQPLWKTAAEANVPVVVHAGQETPGDTAAAEVDELGAVLRAHPGVNVVLAHAGHPATARTLDLMSRFDNLYADLTPVWDRPVALGRQELERFPGRFLFGSDAPNNPIPPVEQVRRLLAMGLAEDDVVMLMGGTAERLTE
jgi:hypothetical protein